MFCPFTQQMDDYCGISCSNCSTIINKDTAITLHGSVVTQVTLINSFFANLTIDM